MCDMEGIIDVEEPAEIFRQVVLLPHHLQLHQLLGQEAVLPALHLHPRHPPLAPHHRRLTHDRQDPPLVKNIPRIQREPQRAQPPLQRPLHQDPQQGGRTLLRQHPRQQPLQDTQGHHQAALRRQAEDHQKGRLHRELQRVHAHQEQTCLRIRINAYSRSQL